MKILCAYCGIELSFIKAHLWNNKPICPECLNKFKSPKQQIDYDIWCRRCNNYEFKMESGILCAITHNKPDFEEECKDFHHDLSREEKIKNEKRKELISNKNQQTIDALPVPKSVKILGWLEIVFDLPILLISIALILYSFISHGEMNNVLVVMWAFIILLISGLLALGILLKKGSSMARVIMIGFYVIRLIGFPIGTLWGAYGIYYLAFDENVKSYYAKKRLIYSY